MKVLLENKSYSQIIFGLKLGSFFNSENNYFLIVIFIKFIKVTKSYLSHYLIVTKSYINVSIYNEYDDHD
jgi:hypothetical protein